MLSQAFLQLASEYTTDSALVQKLWAEVEQKHSESGRYYHTLIHLENLVAELSAVQSHITHWPELLFAICYHDSVYKVQKQDNEEKSAQLAQARLTELGVPPQSRVRCVQLILATKGHAASEDSDTCFFTDADLSILGKPWEAYEAYYRQIRQEYKVYPSLLYNPGRKKVLNHFLQMPRIFKTQYFYQQYEQQARKNLQQELNLL
ncbi:putative metal-dependent HD superfamily phosphohydrolase [Filimonas zeae]|uniref:Metal-dependent HD superfamily phosphohydrolase n=1 Tax=Filimonas zeae TaxID=1737353 RepID=A0A917J345_9BACT|nr:hypothetical protein [Filimonas zeae]MDR6342388.1 putative metal-dependent HD superfamily phosphohydrolase [Filimonas zeae]GGH81128.1 hypothetical protein GCM10011379_53040 [Filimonas zeae]